MTNDWSPPTYGQIKARRRWLVARTDEGKQPAAGWRHPRSFTATGGERVRKVANRRGDGPAVTKHGLKVTSATPETWLDYEEAQAVCAGTPWLPAYVHGNPPGGNDDLPLFFMDLDIPPDAPPSVREWASQVVDEIRTLPGVNGRAWMRSVSGSGRHQVLAMHPDDRAAWVRFFDLHAPKGCRQRALVPPNDPLGETGHLEWWDYLRGRGRYRLTTDTFGPGQPWDDDLEIPVLRYQDWASLPSVAEFAEVCATPQPTAQSAKDEAYPGDILYERSDRGDATRFIDYASRNGRPVLFVQGAGVFYQADNGVLADMETGDGLQTLYRALPSVTDVYATEMESLGYPASAGKLRSHRAHQDSIKRMTGVAEALGALAGGDPQVVVKLDDTYIQPEHLDNRTTPGPVFRVADGVLDVMTGQVAGLDEAYERRITTRMPVTPYSPNARLPEQAVGYATAIREAWGLGWQQIAWSLMHPMAKRYLVLVGERDRGKSLLFELLQMLGMAIMADAGVATELTGKGRTAQFSRIRPLLTRYPLVVIDEAANQGVEQDQQTGDTGGDQAFGSNALKELSAASTLSYEAKHTQGTVTGMVNGLIVIIANEPPLIDVRAPALASRLLAVRPPDDSPALALGALGRERLLTPEVGQAVLRLMLEDMRAMWRAPEVPVVADVQAQLLDGCLKRYQAYAERRKGRRAA